jgi:hypothetical protein
MCSLSNIVLCLSCQRKLILFKKIHSLKLKCHENYFIHTVLPSFSFVSLINTVTYQLSRDRDRTPDASSCFRSDLTTLGMLTPRMTTTEKMLLQVQLMA